MEKSIYDHEIKLIALDLDGTTLKSADTLSERVKSALKNAIERGAEVVIATGRCLGALPKVIRDFDGVNYFITSNGAKIYDAATGECIYSNCIDAQAMPAIYDTLKDCGFSVEIFTDGIAYMEKSQYEGVLDAICLDGRRVEYVLNTRTPKENILEYMMEHQGNIENINILFEDQGDKARFREVLAKLENVTLTSSFDTNLELGGLTTGKGNALTYLCEKLGISKENTMACGDSPNDNDMLLKTGFPVAMGNAKPEVKAIASYITDSNVDDGVATVIEKVMGF